MSAFALAGPLGVVLLLCAALLGAALGDRALTLWGARRQVRALAPPAPSADGTARFFHVVGALDALLGRHRAVVHVLVVLAPLLGLLGTVMGMIDTFSALTDAEVYERSGGVAAGVSQALITTELGLVIAAPGVLLSRMLTRQEESVRNRLGAAVADARRRRRGVAA